MQITALITLDVDGKTVHPLETATLDKKEAERLIARGFATTATVGFSGEDSSNTDTNTGPSIDDVIEVIDMLDPKKDYGKSGKPNVDAIETVLEADISAELRNQAWEQILKDREAEAS